MFHGTRTMQVANSDYSYTAESYVTVVLNLRCKEPPTSGNKITQVINTDYHYVNESLSSSEESK
ncbi:hypothetical protein AVEN_127144-1, partial [Araneus ventricosus]